MLAQFEAIRAKSIGEDQLRACFNIFAMNFCDRRWIREIEFVEALVKANTARMQHRSHCSVCENGFSREPFQ